MITEKNHHTSGSLHMPEGFFKATKVAIVPYPALGDITIYLRLGWLFHCSGAQVTFYSNALYSAREYFPWLLILPEHGEELDELSRDFDLVVACFENYYYKKVWTPKYAELGNVAFVTAKKINHESGVDGRDVYVRERCFFGASRAFCLDSDAGKNMVDWVDSYAKEVFSIEASPMPDCSGGRYLNRDAGLVLIFPTTPQPKKNYWLAGFRWLAGALRKRGWRVEFVCMPNEREWMVNKLPGYEVKCFPDIGELIGHVAGASVVISNDSGGGHLASMLGLVTFTITRRHRAFTWRPGFNELNSVIYPRFRFKILGGRYVWRPFVPVWEIAKKMGWHN